MCYHLKVSERQALSNLIRRSRSRKPIMTDDSLSQAHVASRCRRPSLAGLEHRREVSLFPALSCFAAVGKTFLCVCAVVQECLNYWNGFYCSWLTMASTQFHAARSWEALFAFDLRFNALRRACKAYIASSTACSSSILSSVE